MYHVVASDLDGTLLSPAHSLTPYTKETLRLLTINKGVHFVLPPAAIMWMWRRSVTHWELTRL